MAHLLDSGRHTGFGISIAVPAGMVETLLAGAVVAGSIVTAFFFQRALLEVWFRALGPRNQDKV